MRAMPSLASRAAQMLGSSSANMSHRLGRIERLVLAAGLLAALSYWLLTARAARLQVQLRDARSSQTSPFIVNGIVFSPCAH